VNFLKSGPKPIPFRELSAERLANAIRRAVSSQELIRQAGELGDKLRKENAISNAVEII
jgi:sterol 3beta-glucosyltransferase